MTRANASSVINAPIEQVWAHIRDFNALDDWHPGIRSSVSASFSMPRGLGYLGANPGNGENMTGTIYRVTVYDEILPDAVIQRHIG